MSDQQAGWSKKLLYQLVDSVKDYAIVVSDPEGSIVSWNVGAEKLFGYTPEQAIGMDSAVLFTPEDRANNVPENERQTARETGCADDERWHLRKDGSRFYVSGVQTALYGEHGQLTGFAKIARDLTERVTAQEELRRAYDEVETKVRERTTELNDSNEALRHQILETRQSERERAALLRKLVNTQEDERKRIARDIHDHIGQQTTALQLRIKLVLDKYRDDPSLAAELARLQEMAAQLDSEIDFLAWELRPAVLDDFGLTAAMDNFVQEFSAHFNITTRFEHIGLNGRRLTPEIETNLYRIAQEALNNAAKYAQASHIAVVLEHLNDHVSLIVEDDGVGFDASTGAVVTGNDRGMGLLGIKERAEIVGGAAEIESSPGKGTTVYARIPARFDYQADRSQPLAAPREKINT